MICENCGISWGSFTPYWEYTLKNGDTLVFCCEKCYDKIVNKIEKDLKNE